MRVLLISPVRGFDPANGDVRYTELLEAFPPENVVYENYEAAIQRGAVEELRGRRAITMLLRGDCYGFGVALATGLTNQLRRREWMFAVPWRFFRIHDTEYDLVHLHYFSARIVGTVLPVVVSNANPLSSYFRNVRNYSESKLVRQETAEVILSRPFGLNVNSYRMPQATRVVAFTEFMRQQIARQAAAPKPIDVVPPYMPALERPPFAAIPKAIGFVAYDFVAKGGPVLLEAFQQVRRVMPSTSLTIVTPVRHHVQRPGVRWLQPQPNELLIEILRTIDVFALPTRFEGLMSVLAALSLGTPVVCSNYEALPEVLGDPPAGILWDPAGPGSLADALCRALDPVTHLELSRLARRRFDAAYSLDVGRVALGHTYAQAIAATTPSGDRIRTHQRL